MSTQRKPGPVPKGVRATFSMRMPPEHKAMYEQLAREAGLPLCDYLTAVLAKVHELPEPEYVHRKSRQKEQLPMSA